MHMIANTDAINKLLVINDMTKKKNEPAKPVTINASSKYFISCPPILNLILSPYMLCLMPVCGIWLVELYNYITSKFCNSDRVVSMHVINSYNYLYHVVILLYLTY